MERVIVTGANGFIGTKLINKLLQNNTEVIAIDVNFNNTLIVDSPYVIKKEINLNDKVLLMNQLSDQEYDAFYHFAWRGVNGPDKADPIVQLKNIEMMINCAYVAKQIKCKKFLCSGTIAEHSVESLNHLETTSGGMMYGVSKHCAHLMLENYCKNIGLDFVWMQFSNIYGPGNCTGNLISYTLNQILNDNEATFGPAMQPYDFIYIDDLIEAIMRLGDSNTKKNFYYIGSGEPRILKDYLLSISNYCHKRELTKIGERPDDNIKYSFDMFDTTSLVNDIGNYVSFTFDEGLKMTVTSYMEDKK